MSQELFAAARSGDAVQIKRLLEAGADHATADEAGETALMHAAHGGHFAAVQVLIAAGADINAKAQQGWTALAKAAYNGETGRGYVEVVEVLHQAGASLDERIFFGITPLMLAAGGGDAAVVEWLINAGADVLANNGGAPRHDGERQVLCGRDQPADRSRAPARRAGRRLVLVDPKRGQAAGRQPDEADHALIV
jgi:ankyrin repeat protein